MESILTEYNDTLCVINRELKLWKSKEDGFIHVLTQLIHDKIKIKSIVFDDSFPPFLYLNEYY